MNFRKNIGIILMMLGVLLTINQSETRIAFIEQLQSMLYTYWPLLLSFFGIYLLSTPKKRR